MVNFVLNGKAVASQDRSKAGVPFIKKIISQDIKNEDGSITKISGEYEIVPAVKVMSYRNEMDGSVLGTATSGFDGKTKLEMADGSTVKPKAGQYRLFVGEVENDSGKMETKVIAIQPLSDAKLPKGISKEADYLMLDTKSIYEQLDMKNAHLTVITVPSNIKSPERAVDWQQGELQNYLSDIGGGLKSIPPTEANFNFSASTRNIESLKPEALSSLVTKELRKTEFTISP